MRGNTEDSTTKKKVMSFYSTDGFGFSVSCNAGPSTVVFTIQTEGGFQDIELDRAEANEVADFIRRGV